MLHESLFFKWNFNICRENVFYCLLIFMECRNATMLNITFCLRMWSCCKWENIQQVSCCNLKFNDDMNSNLFKKQRWLITYDNESNAVAECSTKSQLISQNTTIEAFIYNLVMYPIFQFEIKLTHRETNILLLALSARSLSTLLMQITSPLFAHEMR